MFDVIDIMWVKQMGLTFFAHTVLEDWLLLEDLFLSFT